MLMSRTRLAAVSHGLLATPSEHPLICQTRIVNGCIEGELPLTVMEQTSGRRVLNDERGPGPIRHALMRFAEFQ